MADEKIKRGFMDGIDWQHHLEHDPKGSLVFPSTESTIRGKNCLAKGGGCGVAEVEIRFVRWAVEQDIHGEKPIKVLPGTTEEQRK